MTSADAAAVARPDRVRGHVVHAVVVLCGGWQPSDDLRAEIQRHCRNVAAPYKYPRSLSFVDALPRTATGKLLRRQLRDEMADS